MQIMEENDHCLSELLRIIIYCSILQGRCSTVLFSRYLNKNYHQVMCILLWKFAILPLLLSMRRSKYLANHRPTFNYLYTSNTKTKSECLTLKIKKKNMRDLLWIVIQKLPCHLSTCPYMPIFTVLDPTYTQNSEIPNGFPWK